LKNRNSLTTLQNCIFEAAVKEAVRSKIEAFFQNFFSFFSAFDLQEVQQEFLVSFSGPYTSVLEILANEALKPLSEAPVPTSSDAAQATIGTFTAAAKRFHDALGPLSQKLEAHQSYLAFERKKQVFQNSVKENELRAKSLAIASLVQVIKGKEADLAIADRQLAVAEESFQAANSRLRDAERAVKAARNCIIRKKTKHFRRFLQISGVGLGDCGSRNCQRPLSYYFRH
jgi:hypothetical protein